MPYSTITGVVSRPNRLKDEKNEEYHRKYAQWILGSLNSSTHQSFITKSAINWAFYKGNQWIFQEDLNAFLMDESGDERNRIKFVENLIRPMVEQYVGNAIRISFDMQAVSISEFAVNRREIELARLKILAQTAAQSDVFGEAMREMFPIGETEAETEEIFENIYNDDFEDAINHLIEYVMEFNDFEDKKVILAKHLALDGIGILYGSEYNGEYLWEVQDPRYFIFDRSAQRPDLKDSEYMGRYHHMIPSNIYEKFQNINSEAREAIEDFTKDADKHAANVWKHGMFLPSGRVPVYELYWRDIGQKEFGYVIDEYGYEFFTEINSENSKYTDKDLIKPKEKGHDKILNGKKKKKIFVDVLRYCTYIPSEIVSTKNSDDIVLESGIFDYSETNLSDPSGVEFPFKCYCWSYNNGDILSPVDDAISPQRYLNRLQSVAEASVNNSRMSGTVFDKDMIDAQGGEDEMQRNINLGKPLFVQAKGNLNNSLGSYDFTAGNGTVNLYNIAQNVRQSIQNITGVNESMQGTAGGGRRLVGVTQLDIQRGTLIQEPFYYALSRIILQAAQSIATVGKRIYSDNKRKLSIIAGDKGARNIIITDDMMIEDFRVFVKRTSGDEEQKQSGNQILFTLIQAGLIDGKRFANNFNRGNVDDIAKAMREFQKEKIEMEREMEKQQNTIKTQEAEQLAGQAGLEHAMKDEDAQREEIVKDADLERDVTKIRERELAKGLR